MFKTYHSVVIYKQYSELHIMILHDIHRFSLFTQVVQIVLLRNRESLKKLGDIVMVLTCLLLDDCHFTSCICNVENVLRNQTCSVPLVDRAIRRVVFCVAAE